ncbi:hypothetical protein OSB04_017459 [Centaurea solstitialis]|uniref:Uncharacterized protein n=1 Tax=Centaurea solstitialis TaxID=347529 RepID=A0AA38WKR0_9ASTR|nr:hypothetical protein OSB04_017459 [Centaurea solstitialis]
MVGQKKLESWEEEWRCCCMTRSETVSIEILPLQIVESGDGDRGKLRDEANHEEWEDEDRGELQRSFYQIKNGGKHKISRFSDISLPIYVLTFGPKPSHAKANLN